ncbi:MAG: LytTR family DNA-binding domain-containing protein [Thermoanaerobaculia bacterium]|nr:LytTR family DNA-binding domain-containing protein [Thermoanaerobaculia bacterium]
MEDERVLKDRILVEVDRGELRAVDPGEVYLLEAEGDETHVRLRTAQTFVSYRSLGRLEELFAPYGFLRVHRNHMVNLRRIHTVRRRKSGRDWEVTLDPPVNRVVPVSRGRLQELWEAFGR